MKMMFRDASTELNWGFATENELWDYKRDCPKLGKDHLNAWADLAREVLGMHNNGGGILVFGVSDNYVFEGAHNRLDSKQLNDGLRRYVPDRLWVDFHRPVIRSDQSFLGVALIPPRGAVLERFTSDAPLISGKGLFLTGWSALRTIELLDPIKNHANPKTKERCLPLLLKAYERKGDQMKAVQVKDLIEAG